MTALGDDHYARIWSHKNIIDIRNYVPGTNLRVDLAANNLRPGRRLLDIGCGDGLLGALVKDRFEEVYGVDISERAVEIARQRGVIASRINLNIQGLPFNDNFFDSITCLATIQYIYDLHFICREFNRLLRSGGELILTAPNMRTYRRIYKLVFLGEFPRTSFDSEGYDGGTLHYFCFRNIRDLLKNSGFRMDMHRGIFCKPDFLEKLPNLGWIGRFKTEFLGSEIYIRAVKVVQLAE